ncbi:hypothetical protein HMI55_003567 [Coelomomyces lativittatus]|nr:hypothetical protein HMI55_003567 [Coelomomyces lativittatus]
MNFVHSFRLLLSTINFKDQDQSIDYLKNAYCSVYCQKNPGYLFSEAELRLLIDDILDINAAVHNGNSHLISKSEFLQKHQTAPESLLHELWDSVCNEELKMASHGTNFLDLSHMPENITLNETISFELSTPSDLKNIKVKVQAPPGISFNPTELNFGNESVCKVELKGLTLGTWKIHFFPLENSHNLLEYINPKIISVEPSFITNTFTLKYTQKSEDEEPHSFFTFAISKTSQLHTFRKHIEEAIIKYKKRN